LIGKRVAVLCEGELDALLLAQHAGDLAGVATLGSASHRADIGDFMDYLLPVPRYLVAYDLDGAGGTGAATLASITRRARRVSVPSLPGVKDLTDFHKAGGNLHAWLTFELARLELPAQPPIASTPRPICQQPAEVEEAWWAGVFAERGIPDPAGVIAGTLPALSGQVTSIASTPAGVPAPTQSADSPPPPDEDPDYWHFVKANEAEALALAEAENGR
jgi:hypothetical protein